MARKPRLTRNQKTGKKQPEPITFSTEAEWLGERKPLLDFTSGVLVEMGNILHVRGATYFDFADNTSSVVGILRALGFEFPTQFSDQEIGALIHLAAKLSRIPQSPQHRDNWLDLANYGVLALAMNDRADNHIPASKEKE